MQKLSIVVYKAHPPAVLDQLIAQPLHIISVFLDIPCLGIHLCLLVNSGETLFFHDTILTVVCKIIYTVRILFLEKLVFLVVAVSGFFFAFCFLDSVSGGVIGIADDCTVPAFFQQLFSDIILVADVKGAASCGQPLYAGFSSAVSVAITVISVIRPAPCVTLSIISAPGWSKRLSLTPAHRSDLGPESYGSSAQGSILSCRKALLGS